MTWQRSLFFFRAVVTLVLERIPEVGEYVAVEGQLDVEDLDTGVVPDACGDISNVQHCQGNQELVEVGSHLRLPGNRNMMNTFRDNWKWFFD